MNRPSDTPNESWEDPELTWPNATARYALAAPAKPAPMADTSDGAPLWEDTAHA